MKRLEKRDYINMAILTLIFLIIVALLTKFESIYGSTTDWQQQHCVFPDYFRKLFYNTHDPFPDFAFNIGGGQNIYNFAYYGFLNPVIMLSYLLPFVKMIDYIVIASIISVIASVVIFYIWLKGNGYTSGICFFAGLLFLLSGPLIFHSHKHIMFMNYFPFLILALIGTDRFFNKKKSLLLAISVFLLILTSYFFSVGGIAAIFLYGIYKYLKTEKEVKLKSLFSMLLRLAVPVITGIFASGILILPTFSALLSGRGNAEKTQSLFDMSLLIPFGNNDEFLYSPYSFGITSFVIIAFIGCLLSKKKERIFLSVTIMILIIIPLFSFLFNGMLYARSKSLIPLLPLVFLLAADYTDDLLKKNTSKKIPVIFAVLAIIIALTDNSPYTKYFVIDAAVSFTGVFLYLLSNKKILMYAPISAICLIFCYYVNTQDEFLPSAENQKISDCGAKELTEAVLKNDKSFYRFSNEMYPYDNVNKVFSADYYQTTVYSSVYNKYYNTFYYDIFNNEINFRNSVFTNSSRNVLFDILMGNKYLLTDQSAPIGYEYVDSCGKTKLYKSDDVFPLGYVTDKIMSESSFDKLNYPDSDEALLKYCVVNKDCTDDFSSNIKEYDSKFTVSDFSNLDYEYEDGVYKIHAHENANMNIKLDKPVENKVIFIRFDMGYQSQDVDFFVVINGAKNKLTCKSGAYPNNNFKFDFVVSSDQPIETLDVEFKCGEYLISGIKVYTLDYNEVKEIKNTVDPFVVDMDKTSGDKICGKVNAQRDGYFVLNIPYDEGFEITVDGKKVDYEKVNKAFIGFDITKGEKDIEITYNSPLRREGIILSILGILSGLGLCIYEKRKAEAPEKS